MISRGRTQWTSTSRRNDGGCFIGQTSARTDVGTSRARPRSGGVNRGGRLNRARSHTMRVGPSGLHGVTVTLLACLLMPAATSHAQVTTTITSSGLGTVVTPAAGGTTFNITGGTRSLQG